MAVLRRLVEPAQYTSLAFGRRCQEAGVGPSMGSVGDAYDNALCESFFATLECELLDRGASRPRPRRGSRSSTSSRAGTTRTVGTPRSTTSRRCAMKSSIASRRHDPKVQTRPRNRGNSSHDSEITAFVASLRPSRGRTSGRSPKDKGCMLFDTPRLSSFLTGYQERSTN